MFKKFKQKFKAFMTGKSGFSLVELIVVIAIMAIMAAVLAPALLGYVEKSRMQKDDSAMDEVVNAIQLSLADQAIYDEVLEHSVWDNVSCYIDKKEESHFADCKISLKTANSAAGHAEQYMFGDEARLLDETVYYAAGNMRGLTITFSPSESGDTYDFANGILNKFVGRKTGILSENPELYNRLRSVIGDKLKTTSQTYRNSDYTIFIRVGSTGGAEAVQQDAIQVWGQFNGTNLSEKDHKYELSSGREVGLAGAGDSISNTTNNNSGTTPDFSENALKTMSIFINGETKTLQYEEGMTWYEWIDSPYHDGTLLEKYTSIGGVKWIKFVNGNDQWLAVGGTFFNNKYNTYTELLNSNESGYTSVNIYGDNIIAPISYFAKSGRGSVSIYSDIVFALIDVEESGCYYVCDDKQGIVTVPAPSDKDSLPQFVKDWISGM